MKKLSLLLAPAVIAAGCATDPARHLTANNDDVEITPDGHFIRGNEHLDEEEFYSLVGDKKATDKVKEDRAQGEMFQPLGIGVGVAGVALAGLGYGAYYLATSGDGTKVNNFATAETYGGYAGMLGGIAAAVGGGYLWWDGHERALGTNRIFDEKYALNSLETARYGTGGATQSTVASLELNTVDGNPTFCSVGGIGLKPLVARDEKHRTIKITPERQSWFQWTANPATGLAPTHDAIYSPLQQSLAELGKDVIVNVKVDAPTNVATSLDLKADYGCTKRAFGFGGESGSSGSEGSFGQSAGSAGQSGGAGGIGGQGADGQRGHDVDVEASALQGPNGEHLVVAAISERGGGNVELAVFDPQRAGPLLIAANGGQGGQGGGGGSGGNGWSYGSGDTCSPGGMGGNGGSGGSGGRGGDGGSVHIRADSQAVLQALVANVDGGSGGGAGFAGNGGSGGSGDSCGTDHAAAGAAGASGASGAAGSNGRAGRVDAAVAPKGNMRMIAQAMASMGKSSPSPETVAASAPAKTPTKETAAATKKPKKK